jgi:hypothetical protein
MRKHDTLHTKPLSRLTPHLNPQPDERLCAQIIIVMISACKEYALVWVGRSLNLSHSASVYACTSKKSTRRCSHSA